MRPVRPSPKPLVPAAAALAALGAGCEPAPVSLPARQTALETQIVEMSRSTNAFQRAIDLAAAGHVDEAASQLSSAVGSPSEFRLHSLSPAAMRALGDEARAEAAKIVERRGSAAETLMQHLIESAAIARAAGRDDEAELLCATLAACIAANRGMAPPRLAPSYVEGWAAKWEAHADRACP